MSLAQVLSTYLTLNVLAAVGFVGLRLWGIIVKRKGTMASAARELKLHYWIIAAIGMITIAHPFLPRSEIFQPAAKVWSAQSMRSFPDDYVATDDGGYLMLPTPSGSFSVQSEKVSALLLLIGFVLGLLAGFRVWRDIHSLLRIRRRSYSIRKLASVNVFLNEEITVPFSSWLPGRTDVVIPTSLLSKGQDFKIAIAHELQHHRQGDTKWVYAIWAFKVLCAANPFVYLWNRWISELQEFACDETLVDQHKVDSQQYARCLVEVAETANNQKYVPACATGLVFLVERNLLKRRIERMINMNINKSGRSMSLSIGLAIVALMAGIAYASNGFVQDRRVSMEDAQRFAKKAEQNTDFPVVVNDLVLKQLNRYIGTPEGRDFMRNALQRMENYRTVIEGKINRYQVPNELIAVPIAESGYQNLDARVNPVKAAGLWQFMGQTARNYGLQVDDQKDERLNVPLATDAAIRYLQSSNLRFNDWQLSLMAYNMGERAVDRAIKATGSRDAWTLIRNGYEGDKDYLPKIMAAILIMKNPESVE